MIDNMKNSFYTFTLILTILLCIDKKLSMKHLEHKRPNSDRVANTILGPIGSVEVDTLPTYKCIFPAYCPAIEGKPKNWGEVIELNK